jgi:hypothetical protein
MEYDLTMNGEKIMNIKKIFVLMIAAIIVYFAIKVLLIITGFLFQIGIFLVVAFVLYLFLKELS